MRGISAAWWSVLVMVGVASRIGVARAEPSDAATPDAATPDAGEAPAESAASAPAPEAAPSPSGTAAAPRSAPSSGDFSVADMTADEPPRPQTEANRRGPPPRAQGRLGQEGRTMGPYQRQGAEPPPIPKQSERSPIARSEGYFWHDGFFLRLGGGVGLLHDRLDTSAEGYGLPDHGGRTGGANGVAIATEISVGTEVASGLILGAGSYTTLAPGLTTKGNTAYSLEASQLALFGPFVTFYPNPAQGFNFGGGLGVASIIPGVAQSPGPKIQPIQPHAAVGLGGMLGVGYEWFVARQWSAGLTGRFMMAMGVGEDSLGTTWTHLATGYSVLFTVTYN